MKTQSIIAGSGGGGGSSTPYRPVEAPDSLQSKQIISLTELLGEGVIGGPVVKTISGTPTMLGSVFFNDTPIMNDDGTVNYKLESFEFRGGQQVQDHIPGFSKIESPFTEGVRIKANQPHTITITNPNADAVRIILTVPALAVTKDNGDTVGGSIAYRFKISTDGGPFTQVLTGTPNNELVISGKTRSRYNRSHIVNLPKPGATWSIRVERVTPDSTTSMVVNELWFDTYVEIVNVKMSYPNSAIVGLRVDSSQFNSIPNRSYLVDGLYIRVPTNYDPVARTYTGIWNGTFKVAISNNPAWVLFDLLTNERYGLGRFVGEARVDKARLYEIGKFCDDMVSDGRGGVEPRFTINTAIQAQAEAYKVVADLCSVFQGMAYWAGGEVSFFVDKPTDPVMTYSQANVIDGIFNYTSNSRRDRSSVVLVRWNDPEHMYKQKIEYVESQELIERFGHRKMETLAFGCTSRGQAHRVGRWMLLTEDYESEIVTFKVGIDSALVVPGDIIKVNDQFRAGKRMGGRLVSCTATSATLDAPIELGQAGSIITMRLPDGTLVDRTVMQGIGTWTVLTWTTPLADVPLDNSMWIVAEPNLQSQLFRVIGIMQEGVSPNSFAISATKHHPGKRAAVDGGFDLEELPTRPAISTLPTPVVTNVLITEVRRPVSENVLMNVMSVSWTSDAPLFFVSYRRTGDEQTNWQTFQTSSSSYDIENVAAGDYEVSIVADRFGNRSSPVLVTHTFTISDATPPDVTGLKLREAWEDTNVAFEWDAVEFCPKYQVVISVGAAIRRDVEVTTNTFEYTREMAHADGGLTRDLTIKVKGIRPSGTKSANFATLTVSNPPPQLMSIAINPAYLAIDISYVKPSDPDFAGVQVWMSDVSGFAPNAGNLVYDGNGTRILLQLDAGGQPLTAKPYYLRYRAYDTFDKSASVTSNEFTVTPYSASLGLGPGEIVGTHISVGAIAAENLKTKRHLID